MTEYRSRLVQTGWSEERQLAGDVVISMYRRRDTQSECELSFHPAVFTKFPVNYMALEAKGPTALQEFQSDPQNLNAFIFNVDRYCGKSGQ